MEIVYIQSESLLLVFDENNLLSQAQVLDREALSQIHDQYYDSIYRYISYSVSDVQSVEDLTSEVFIRFLSALRKTFGKPKCIRGWLYGTASRVIKEYYRSQWKANYLELDESFPDQSIGPEQSTQDKWTNHALRDALQKLTMDQQNILALRFGCELSIQEVAKTMNKSEGSVKMAQMRAIAVLAGHLSVLKVTS
jgi:RNA polymerase sigma-70 factor (ECF subfamily)